MSSALPLPPAGSTIVPVWPQRRAEALRPPPWLAHAAQHAERRFETPFDANGDFADLVALRYVYVRAGSRYYAAPCEALKALDARLVWCAESGHVPGLFGGQSGQSGQSGASAAASAASARMMQSVRGKHVRAIEAARKTGEASAVFEAHAAAMRAIISTRGPDGFIGADDIPGIRPIFCALASESATSALWGSIGPLSAYLDDAAYLCVCAVLVGMRGARIGRGERLLECLGRALVRSTGGDFLLQTVGIAQRAIRAHAHRIPWLGRVLDSSGLRCTIVWLVAVGVRSAPHVPLATPWLRELTSEPASECAAWALADTPPWVRRLVDIALAVLDIWHVLEGVSKLGAATATTAGIDSTLRELAVGSALDARTIDRKVDAILRGLFPAKAEHYARLVPRRILRAALAVAAGSWGSAGSGGAAVDNPTRLIAAIRATSTGVSSTLLECLARS